MTTVAGRTLGTARVIEHGSFVDFFVSCGRAVLEHEVASTMRAINDAVAHMTADDNDDRPSGLCPRLINVRCVSWGRDRESVFVVRVTLHSADPDLIEAMKELTF